MSLEDARRREGGRHTAPPSLFFSANQLVKYVTRQLAYPVPPNFSYCVCKSITQEIRRRPKNSRERELLKARHCAFHRCCVGVVGFQKTLVLPFSKGLCEHTLAQ